MLKFYYSAAPNPTKVALFLEETGLPHEAIPVDTRKGDQHKPEYLAINPNAKVPAIVDGDAVVFDFRTVHGAAGNTGTGRRRAFSARFLGDDVRYIARPGRTSPPFPGIGLADGERMREDWFPVVWRATQ